MASHGTSRGQGWRGRIGRRGGGRGLRLKYIGRGGEPGWQGEGRGFGSVVLAACCAVRHMSATCPFREPSERPGRPSRTSECLLCRTAGPVWQQRLGEDDLLGRPWTGVDMDTCNGRDLQPPPTTSIGPGVPLHQGAGPPLTKAPVASGAARDAGAAVGCGRGTKRRGQRGRLGGRASCLIGNGASPRPPVSASPSLTLRPAALSECVVGASSGSAPQNGSAYCARHGATGLVS